MFVFTRQKIAVISSLVILLWMGVGIYVYKSSFPLPEENKFLNSAHLVQDEETCKIGQKLKPGFWRKVNLRKQKIPQSVKESVSMVSVQSDSVTVQGVKVHYVYAMPKQPSSISVLLLHGQSYTSQNWNELGTIGMISAMGYHPIAVDLPGFGRTPSISNIDKARFIDDLISGLHLQKPVLISPSMSGSFSLQYLVEHPGKLGGFVPIAPVGTSILSDVSCKEKETDGAEDVPLNDDCMRIMPFLRTDRPNLNCIKVPSLIVWGEKDKGENSAKLCLLSESQGAEIPEGAHSAYISNPDLWHDLLYNFLNMLNATKACV